MRHDVNGSIGIDSEKHIGVELGEIGLIAPWGAFMSRNFGIETHGEHQASRSHEPL
jgi:hypothetical protein